MTQPDYPERGFTLVETMIASLITMMIMGVAFSTFQNALALNDAVVNITDSTQNLRAGTNLLVRDLLQAGRNIPIGGIPIPSEGADPVLRPSPTGEAYNFDNVTQTTIKAITTGAGLGPIVDGRPTDMVTILMDDPYLAELSLAPSDGPPSVPKLAIDGSSFSVGSSTAWLAGDPENGVAPVKKGDLIYFHGSGEDGTISNLQTVTRIDASTVSFDAGDPFNLNQRDALAGSISDGLPVSCPAAPASCTGFTPVTVRRVLMYTYYVQEDTTDVPRLMRVLNHFPAQALAGVIEDLTLRYDLVDGTHNPTEVATLPYTAHEVTYSASQIRKVNVHVGVRSETISARSQDYLRSHLSTVVSLRNLAYVTRYNTAEESD